MELIKKQKKKQRLLFQFASQNSELHTTVCKTGVVWLKDVKSCALRIETSDSKRYRPYNLQKNPEMKD